MASYTKWQIRLKQAIIDKDQETIDYCKKIFPKDRDGNLTSLYHDTVAEAKEKLENKPAKKTAKTNKKGANTRRRKVKDNELTE